MAVVLGNTTAHARVDTDCLGNVKTLQGGFASATNSRRWAARTWRIIQRACDGVTTCVYLQWVLRINHGNKCWQAAEIPILGSLPWIGRATEPSTP